MGGLTTQPWLFRFVHRIIGHIAVAEGLFGQNYVAILTLRAHEERVSFSPLLRRQQTDTFAHQDIR